jgi:hypothetical protein
MAEANIIQLQATQDFLVRTSNRTAALGASTMALLQSFIDEDGDDYATAKTKTQEVSQEISAAAPAAKMDYTLGDATALIAQVQASALPQMTQAKKDLVIALLQTQA